MITGMCLIVLVLQFGKSVRIVQYQNSEIRLLFNISMMCLNLENLNFSFVLWFPGNIFLSFVELYTKYFIPFRIRTFNKITSIPARNHMKRCHFIWVNDNFRILFRMEYQDFSLKLDNQCHWVWLFWVSN